MNSLTSFLALTGAIFGAITALLVLMSRLEPTWRTQKAWLSRDHKNGPRSEREGPQRGPGRYGHPRLGPK